MVGHTAWVTALGSLRTSALEAHFNFLNSDFQRTALVGVSGAREPPDGGLGINWGPLEEQQQYIRLTTESCLYTRDLFKLSQPCTIYSPQ